MIDKMSEKRLLNWRDASEYTSLKRASLNAFAESIGAIRHFGRRVMYDKAIIDAALDKSKPGENLKKEG